MEITVRAYASLKQTIGQKTITISLPDGATVSDLADALAEEYPDVTPELFADNDLREAIRIHYNGQVLTETDVTLADGDTISLMPQIAGG